MTPPSQRLALIPLDDRPCCRLFPTRLAEMAGHHLQTPPRPLLGKYLDPGDPGRLMDWLETLLKRRQEPPTGLLLSLDMLVWGGLVASRRLDPPADSSLKNLKRLAILSQRRPTWAFMSLMRTAPTQTSLEEVEQATRLTELALWMSRQARDLPGASEKVQALRQGIPASWVDRYLQARRRNLALNLTALRRAVECDWRHLLLGIDDSRHRRPERPGGGPPGGGHRRAERSGHGGPGHRRDGPPDAWSGPWPREPSSRSTSRRGPT